MKAFEEILNRYGVYCQFDCFESGISFIIYQQKLDLLEYDLNHILSDLQWFMAFTIRYVWIGGEGCQLCLSLENCMEHWKLREEYLVKIASP